MFFAVLIFWDIFQSDWKYRPKEGQFSKQYIFLYFIKDGTASYIVNVFNLPFLSSYLVFPLLLARG